MVVGVRYILTLGWIRAFLGLVKIGGGVLGDFLEDL